MKRKLEVTVKFLLYALTIQCFDYFNILSREIQAVEKFRHS